MRTHAVSTDGKSPAFTFVAAAWNGANTSGARATRNYYEKGMAKALEVAIKARMRFDEQDIVELSKIGERDWIYRPETTLYGVALEAGNPSAVKAALRYLKRGAVKIGRKPARLGSIFRWQGMTVECKRFDGDGKSLWVANLASPGSRYLRITYAQINAANRAAQKKRASPSLS